jgi:predicted metal-binding protein
MLKAVANGPAVVACSTCRHSDASREDGEGVRGGTRLAEALKAVKASDSRYDGVAVQEMPCLFACRDFCTVRPANMAASRSPIGRRG